VIESPPQCFHLIADRNEFHSHFACIVFPVSQVTIKCLRRIEQSFLKHRTSQSDCQHNAVCNLATGQLCSESIGAGADWRPSGRQHVRTIPFMPCRFVEHSSCITPGGPRHVDVGNCVTGDWLQGGTGVIIAGGLLLFLLRPKIRAAFALESLSICSGSLT
jgi:hypothetical protein